MQRDLIYDVGVHNGDDTAYYLHKGFKVIGIEANPDAASILRRRFADEITSGVFALLEIGIARQAGIAEFFVYDEHSDWSSLNLVPRSGARGRIIKVKTERFSSILQEYGIPYYCKIDIEGNDHICLEGLTRTDKPRFISIEMWHEHGDRDLKRLQQLGYSRFKIISQVTFGPAIPIIERFAYLLPERVRWRTMMLETAVLGKPRDGGWLFRAGSSGSFADGLPGRWKTYDEILSVWQCLHDLDARANSKGIGGNWYDIHATV